MFHNSPVTCKKLCANKKFQFAGVQFGYECFCGNEAPSGDRITQQPECNFKCIGDWSKKCGGFLRMNVYKTSHNNGLQTTTTNRMTTSTTTTTTTPTTNNNITTTT